MNGFQMNRRSKNSGRDDFLSVADPDDELDDFEDIDEEDDDFVEDEEALDEELNFDKPHFRRLGLDYEEEEDE
jgi:hypothetical protein